MYADAGSLQPSRTSLRFNLQKDPHEERLDAQYPGIQASEAAAKLAELLDAVERGHVVRIARNRKPIARIVPETEVGRAEAAEAIRRLRELRGQVRKAPLDEILTSRHEGHKY